MNDRYKYRIWDKIAKKYADINYDIRLCSRTGKIFVNGLDEESNLFDVEFCTGKKSKDKKLIFDGDRINTSYGKAFVFWFEQRGAWGYEFALDCGLLSDELDSDIEWIGTIHDKEDKHVK